MKLCADIKSKDIGVAHVSLQIQEKRKKEKMKLRK